MASFRYKQAADNRKLLLAVSESEGKCKDGKQFKKKLQKC
jgi:hypothetical protein